MKSEPELQIFKKPFLVDFFGCFYVYHYDNAPGFGYVFRIRIQSTIFLEPVPHHTYRQAVVYMPACIDKNRGCDLLPAMAAQLLVLANGSAQHAASLTPSLALSYLSLSLSSMLLIRIVLRS